MKLIISFLLITINVHAYKIVIQFESGNSIHANQVQRVFAQKFNIPKSLTKVVPVRNCDQTSEIRNYMVLCIDKKKELVILNSSSQIIETLSVFKRL